ncbi:chaplin family protein [Streptomyces sp. NPDC019539]|uniref:chaplin family protein n=1 Tax=Streptomyces sp. NPDC019539 TaxID=3365063 RepID=UPI003793E651
MFRLASSTGAAVLIAGTVFFAGGSIAVADTGAEAMATGSPGVLSGNVVQVPVHVPVNACGNTLNLLGLANEASGNACGTGSEAAAGMPSAVVAESAAASSPGVLAGITVQLPTQVAGNLCGNTLNIAGVANPAYDNTCASSPVYTTLPAPAANTAAVSTPGTPASVIAEGAAASSPGVLSGNTVQLPTQAAANICGNTLNIEGAANAAHSNLCVN